MEHSNKSENRASVHDALNLILRDIHPVTTKETIATDDTSAINRVVCDTIQATCSLPRYDMSAMDGYALNYNDINSCTSVFTVIGESAAGHPSQLEAKAREAVRIFTGAIVPQGTDTVVIQEDIECRDNKAQLIVPFEDIVKGQHIRRAGLDVSKGDDVIVPGSVLSSRHIALLHSLGIDSARVFTKPKIKVFASGDEVKPLGAQLDYGDIFDATSLPLQSLIEKWGGNVVHRATIPDDREALHTALFNDHKHHDLVVTIGGASVGDHDHMHQVLEEAGFQISFWKINMRPGKPLLFATHNQRAPVLALPGNPVSAMVCAWLFLQPAVRKLRGECGDLSPRFIQGRLGVNLNQNGSREDYMRCTISVHEDGYYEVLPFKVQDSSMIKTFADAHGLMRRPPHDPPSLVGEEVWFTFLD